MAENFKTLEAFFPGRIDLGVGRSPGGSELTQQALTDGGKNRLNEFPRQLADLQGFLHNTLPREHRYRLVKAGPRLEQAPPIWVLGLSERSAKLAAETGVGYIFGHFINPENGQRSLAAYGDHFKPSVTFERPHRMACVFVICAETSEKAEELALSQDRWLLSTGKGGDTKVPSIDEVKAKTISPEDRQTIEENRQRTIIGTPDDVKKKVEALAQDYQTDELMIITNIYDFEAKVHSYRLLAEAFQLDKDK
ncbi:putative monooxygenase / Coenzyme F420-dependent N5,N10-methylene tetrahydromethanopterin reductase [Gracilibacillus halophilus YIM-C55.5]|uniref:Putative monooxygenase / Coenzyme F420-dependent N5,N10-methylene tetrahydromethanopterin reductase n=1 Tax=Gracilibacillus halophilus YIM-C55.5 TaxID=1308866 RepID=N4W8P1_9BACI|nr:putative monooxygenase / Coenzyme F420-dependent N5,N10-methylene tetrahydromethanopterin reductase [Gracilibacillus halophilus YIM-C55.5]